MPATVRRGTIDVPVVSTGSVKRAERVADRIVEDVMALGWPVGQVLGSETELLERYKVSRAVFREAVRIVEHQQVVRTRRGPSGGLMVTEPTVGVVIDAVVLYLRRVDARVDEVFEARILLEEIATELAATRPDAGGRKDLEAFVAQGEAADCDPRTLHALVASSTANPAIELFVEVLSCIALLYSPEGERLDAVAEMAHAHAQIARAIVAGDPELAVRRMRRHLEAEAEFLRARRSTRQVLDKSVILSGPTTGKGAEGVARHIARGILADGMQPGDLVGTEPELIEREGVSRALLREAVRLLEHHQIARMRRGPGGGLFVVRPSPSAVTDIAAILLVRRGMQLAELAQLRTGVEAGIADLAAARVDDRGVERMNEALEHEALSTDADLAEAVHDLHAAVASVAQNRVLQLVALVLIRLARLHQVERLAEGAREQIRAEVFRAHQGIADAVAAGDRALATRRMRRHLDALAAAVR